MISATRGNLQSENFILDRIPLNYAGRQAREHVSAYESAILTRGIIDFLLVPRGGPLFLTKKAKLGRSALLEFTPAAPVIF